MAFMERTLANVIRGNFNTISFGPQAKMGTKSNQFKMLYIKLAPNMDPQRVIEAINSQTSFHAVINKSAPDVKVNKKHQVQISKIPLDAKNLLITHEEILTEMQSKFTGLYNLAKKTNFKLLDEISWVVFERLKTIVDRNPETAAVGFRLSSAYRKAHPHFGDFQLILSTLHKLQDLAGAPRAHIVESELCKVSDQPYVIDNVPMDKVTSVCGKYSDKITKKIKDHLDSLEVDVQSGNAEEDQARRKVREQLKKLSPFMHRIVREVILNHFIPQKSPYHKVRIYGEPFLPNRDLMAPLTKRCGATSVLRSDRMYNLLKISVPVGKYQQLFAQDGTMVGGAKINIRSSFVPLYYTARELKNQMKHTLGITDHDEPLEQENPEDDDFEMAMEE